MNEYTENKLYHLGCILRNIGLTKEETGGILSMLETEELSDELIMKLIQKKLSTVPVRCFFYFTRFDRFFDEKAVYCKKQ